MKNLLTIALLLAAVLFSGGAYSQIKGEAACQKFLQEDFFKKLNDWSAAACAPNPSAEEISRRYSAVAQVLAVDKIGDVADVVSAANTYNDGWVGFFRHAADDRQPFHCALVSARAICESRHGVWMQVEYELKYNGKVTVVYNYMSVLNLPFGSMVNMVSANPPNDCVFDPASYITVSGRVVDDLGNSVMDYQVAVKNTYTAKVPNYDVKIRNESFYIENVPPFSSLEFTKPGYEPLVVPVNNKADLQILKMKKAPILLIDVQGQVVDDLGNQLSGFKITLADTALSASDYKTSIKNNTFSIGKISVKSVITFTKPGYDTMEVAVDGRTDLGMVKLSKTPVTEIRVSGKLLDEIGNPLTNFMVMVKDSTVEDYFVTFRDENFTIGDIPYDATLLVTKLGYDTLEVPVDYRTDVGMLKIKRLPLSIISVTGKVVDEIGNSITNFNVVVTDTSGLPANTGAVAIKHDVFTIDRIPIDGTFVVSKPGYEPLEVEVRNRLDVGVLKLKPAPLPIIRVTGKVLDEFGNSLSDFMIRVQDTANKPRSYYEISSRNENFVVGKAPFNAVLTVSKPGYETIDVEIDNRADLGVLKLAKAPTPASMIQGSYTETVNHVPFNMVFVQGGSFIMGASDEQASDAGFLEKPAHKVTLGDYLMSQTEVTLRLWKAVMGGAPAGMSGMDTSASANNMPVVNVSWHECLAFVKKLAAITGKPYCLPTEAEWEYAARGGAMSRGYKYSGGNRIDDLAWYESNSDRKAHAVGLKQPNEIDLYDMSGNVWEWCQDVYRDYDAPDYNPTPAAVEPGESFIYRGGGFGNDAGYSRVSYRHYLSPDFRNNSLGFRVAVKHTFWK